MLRLLSLLLAVSALQAAPRLEFSTFFGGEFGEQGNGVALDAQGNIYVVGQTRDVPAAPGSFSSVTGSTFDVFVLKIDPTGTQLLYQAVFGGSARERGTAIAVDAEGAAYVTGWTFSEDFPVTGGAAQTEFGGGTRDAFVAKLTPDGSALEYATYLGGSTFEDGNAIVVDVDGRAWAVGTSGSVDFPATPDALKSTQPIDTRSAYVTALSPDGDRFEYSTLLGGSGRDLGTAVALGAAGELWIAGNTGSVDFPVTAGVFQKDLAGVDDAFVVRLGIEGPPRILAATLYGGSVCMQPLAGSPCDLANAIHLDAGRLLLAGNTLSPDLPLNGAAAQPGLRRRRRVWGRLRRGAGRRPRTAACCDLPRRLFGRPSEWPPYRPRRRRLCGRHDRFREPSGDGRCLAAGFRRSGRSLCGPASPGSLPAHLLHLARRYGRRPRLRHRRRRRGKGRHNRRDGVARVPVDAGDG